MSPIGHLWVSWRVEAGLEESAKEQSRKMQEGDSYEDLQERDPRLSLAKSEIQLDTTLSLSLLYLHDNILH